MSITVALYLTILEYYNESNETFIFINKKYNQKYVKLLLNELFKKQSVTIECAVAIYFLKNNKKESMIILIVCERYANDKRY